MPQKDGRGCITGEMGKKKKRAKGKRRRRKRGRRDATPALGLAATTWE